MQGQPKIRLYIEGMLLKGAEFWLSPDQTHYLMRVMRLRIGDKFRAFNGQSGEWRASLKGGSKKAALIEVESHLRDPMPVLDVWLYFAPLKKDRTHFLVEKATELGVSRLCPILTDYTNSDRVNVERLRAVALEATEQCEGFHPPEIMPLTKLSHALSSWPSDRTLLFCNEAEAHSLRPIPDGPAGILIGPEGGFSDDERQKIITMRYARVITLGPKILRAETAAIAALTYWHASKGSWI